MNQNRNREIFERRRADFSVGAIADAFGLSAGRVRVILAREELLQRRRLELAEADSRPDQPNPLHLEEKLREKIANILQKQDFTANDIENYKYGFSLAPFLATRNFSRRDWRALVEWMGRAGKGPIPARNWRWTLHAPPD